MEILIQFVENFIDSLIIKRLEYVILSISLKEVTKPGVVRAGKEFTWNVPAERLVGEYEYTKDGAAVKSKCFFCEGFSAVESSKFGILRPISGVKSLTVLFSANPVYVVSDFYFTVSGHVHFKYNDIVYDHDMTKLKLDVTLGLAGDVATFADYGGDI